MASSSAPCLGSDRNLCPSKKKFYNICNQQDSSPVLKGKQISKISFFNQLFWQTTSFVLASTLSSAKNTSYYFFSLTASLSFEVSYLADIKSLCPKNNLRLNFCCPKKHEIIVPIAWIFVIIIHDDVFPLLTKETSSYFFCTFTPWPTPFQTVSPAISHLCLFGENPSNTKMGDYQNFTQDIFYLVVF